MNSSLMLIVGAMSVATPAVDASQEIALPEVDAKEFQGADNNYTPVPDSAIRVHYSIPKTMRGSSIPIKQPHIVELCGDIDGCSVRIGMHNWDDTGRVASREFLFYYNPRNRVWRASLGDTAGTDANNATEHVNNSWACYMTDGGYYNWTDKSDTSEGFSLLSWNQYNADCWLTIID